MTSPDPYDLQRFVDAQAKMYAIALAELHAGRKRSHWIWYIFPQVSGLGYSSMSQRYAIRSVAEAKAYLKHPVLGPRIIECAEAVLQVGGRPIEQIMGNPDDLKLRSSMTLFARVSAPGSVFERVLHTYYGGIEDTKTVEFLHRERPTGTSAPS